MPYVAHEIRDKGRKVWQKFVALVRKLFKKS